MSLYTRAREHIRGGDLLAWSHRGLDSWYDFKVQLVRMVTRSEYSHVAMAFPCGNRLLVLEAVIPRVRIYPLSMLLPCEWFPLNLDWTRENEDIALGTVGQGYSQLQAVIGYFRKAKGPPDKLWSCAEHFIITGSNHFECEETPSAVVQVARERGVASKLLSHDFE